MVVRCYQFSSCLGDVYRWYEELDDGRFMRLVFAFEEHFTLGSHTWHMRLQELSRYLPIDIYDNRKDVTRVG